MKMCVDFGFAVTIEAFQMGGGFLPLISNEFLSVANIYRTLVTDSIFLSKK